MTDHSWIRKIFKNKFSRFVNNKKINKQGQKPSLQHLEDRLVPAVPFVQTPFGANIQAIWSGPDNAQGKFTENPTFRVTFSYPVTGVDVSDFKINVVNLVPGSGTPSPSITQITSSEYVLNVALPANSILPSFVDASVAFTFISVNLKNDATISPQVSFASQQTYAVGSGPQQATMGDVNRDGKLDIITANGNSNNVSVLLGNGNGTFGPKTDFDTGTPISSVTLGDVNGDGRLDIIAANRNTNNVSVLFWAMAMVPLAPKQTSPREVL